MATQERRVPLHMSQLARRLLAEAPVGVEVALTRTGSTLENPHVYDSVARELVAAAGAGLLEIARLEPGGGCPGGLIRLLVFRRIA